MTSTSRVALGRDRTRQAPAARSKLPYPAWADLIFKSASLGFTIFGLWWAYHTFNVTTTDDTPVLNEALNASWTEVDDKLAVLQVDVLLKNIGRHPVRAKSDSPKGEQGLEIWVNSYPIDSQATGRLIDWDRGLSKSQVTPIVTRYNLLEYYPGYDSGNYVLNPGVEYHETAAIPVTRRCLYAVNARFYSVSGWSAAAISYVYVR
jgi:hypothetical protein